MLGGLILYQGLSWSSVDGMGVFEFQRSQEYKDYLERVKSVRQMTAQGEMELFMSS